MVSLQLQTLKVAGDPRRPGEIKRYKRPVANPDDAHTDALLIAALMFGMAGLMFKNKIGAWLALLCCLCSLANMKSVDFDIKQIISSVTFAVFGLVASYQNQRRV
eukprot:jgi/Botrbrau1/15321/Bobra.0319s0007.1